MARYLLAAYGAAFLTAVAHTLLKAGAYRTTGKPFYSLYINPLGACAYMIFMTASLVNLYTYRVLPLRYATTVLPANYVFIGLLAVSFLGERLTRAQWLGALVIFSGIIIFNA